MVQLSKTKSYFSEGNVPPGGTCLSSFVAVLNGKSILLGKMARPEIWIERFLVGSKFAPRYAGSGKYVLPARHLHWYESPLDAAHSLLWDQVGLKVPKGKVFLVDSQSHVSGDIYSEDEPPHWDICFLYRTEISRRDASRLHRPEWFSELTFKPLDSLKLDDFTRGHGDVLEAAGMIGSRRRSSRGKD
jgi:hypothetical protein